MHTRDIVRIGVHACHAHSQILLRSGATAREGKTHNGSPFRAGATTMHYSVTP